MKALEINDYATQQLVLALGKDRHAYLLDAREIHPSSFGVSRPSRLSTQSEPV